MTRIIGHMVTRNEYGRYLQQSLLWLMERVDEVVVYDDQSDDGTLEYLRATGVAVARRPDEVPSFLEDESRFRQAAWRFLESTAWPGGADWILSVDADEFLVTDDAAETVNDALNQAIACAQAESCLAVNFNVREVFGYDRCTPLVRKDAYWGGITACRLVRWRQGATFTPCPEGGGSVPTSWMDWRHMASNLSLLHLGYARAGDRQSKHDRYVGGRHNPTHIASILRPGVLAPWAGMQPPLVAAVVP